MILLLFMSDKTSVVSSEHCNCKHIPVPGTFSKATIVSTVRFDLQASTSGRPTRFHQNMLKTEMMM